MTEIDVDIESGEVRAIDLADIVAGKTLISGPARLMGWSVRDSGPQNATETQGQVLSPGAGAVVATLAGIAAADYDIRWQVQLIGAAAAADQNNFALFFGATQLLTSENAGAAGIYPQTQIEQYGGFGANIVVKTIGAGTVGVTYVAQLSGVLRSVSGPVLQLQDDGHEIAEIGAPIFAVDSKWFGPSGIKIRGSLRTIVNVGQVSGALYLRYER